MDCIVSKHFFLIYLQQETYGKVNKNPDEKQMKLLTNIYKIKTLLFMKCRQTINEIQTKK